MLKYLFIPLLFAGCFYAQQNLNENYKPLKSSGTLPDIFTQNIRNVIKQDITELNKQKDNDKSIKRTYLTEANYEIEKIVKSGNTLVNDEITKYLNEVADIILKNNEPLRKQLNIYTLKSPVVNAYSYDKGYVFIDIGLIAQAETEAQLAYILCHEISHYIKKHNINGYVREKKIDQRKYNGENEDDALIEKCQYSKENESEADVEGFRLFEMTNYDLKQAEKAFDVLQYSHLPFELVEFKKNFFETANYTLPERYFLKEVSSIKNNSNEDDTKMTHPNTSKRKQAIGELISKRDNSGRTKSIIGKDKFEYIRDLSRMELCRLYIKRRDYPNALYAAYILLKKYPQNQYLHETVAKSLYAISLYHKGMIRYNSDSYLESGIPDYSNIESYPQQLYHLISKMPENEWTIMSLNYIYRSHKKFPESKVLSAYSDSLFTLMKNTNWGVVDFVRTNIKEEIKPEIVDTTAKETPSNKTDLIATIQKENNFKSYDTAYYKEIYLDLFMNDKEFVSKFPSGSSVVVNSGFSTYNSGSRSSSTAKKAKKNKWGEYIKTDSKIEKVLLLEPFYLKVDENKPEEIQYLLSDEKQEKFVLTVHDCASRQNFELVTLDPGILTSTDVDKINDYSVITDWFSEKFDANDNDSNPILNTNEIDQIISKYGTQYVFKVGIVNYKPKRGKQRTFYYAYIYDIKNNSVAYKKYEIFSGKDAKDLINAKVYQTFFELKTAGKN